MKEHQKGDFQQSRGDFQQSSLRTAAASVTYCPSYAKQLGEGLSCLTLLMLCVMFSACLTHEGYSPGCKVQGGASLFLTIISRLPKSNLHLLCFLPRGQHEFILHLVSLSIIFVVRRGPCLYCNAKQWCLEPCTRQPSAGQLRRPSTQSIVLYTMAGALLFLGFSCFSLKHCLGVKCVAINFYMLLRWALSQTVSK